MTNKIQPEALRLAEMLTADEWPGSVTLVSYARECVAELRRQHARITELEAQLEAIGAGGVSGPLMGASLAANAGGEPVAYCSAEELQSATENGDVFDAWTKESTGAMPLYTHPSPPEGMAGWISVDEMLPEWAARDDTPCFINHKEVPPTLTSETVLVALKGGGVRTDKLTTIEGKSAGWWHSYGERVIAWQKTPAPPLASEAKEPT